MPTLFFEMKIIKHTFKIPQLSIVNGELVENGSVEETYTFTLLHKGIGLYEEMAGEPLLNTILNINIDDEMQMAKIVLNKQFILNLASASYVKLDENKFHNNRATCEEFKKLPVANYITDIDFVLKLIQMATDCVVDYSKQNKGKKEKKKETGKK